MLALATFLLPLSCFFLPVESARLPSSQLAPDDTIGLTSPSHLSDHADFETSHPRPSPQLVSDDTIVLASLSHLSDHTQAEHGSASSDLIQLRQSRASLVPTPPLGWNSWNHFGCGITEDIIKSTADALVSTGLASLGYVYLNIDDCWCSSRSDEGQLVPDPSTFPSGIKAVADYVHSKGLKIGIYADGGLKTCAGRPGSLGHEVQDAQSFAAWGIDYLKYDNCGSHVRDLRSRFETMQSALDSTGRKIVYAMCEWGLLKAPTWARQVADLWRTTGDIEDSWESVLKIASKNNKWAEYAGPGGWNDPDMLEVGNGGMSTPEYRVHFSLWAIMKAPLLIGTDIRDMDEETLGILGNQEVIAVNQDELGVQAVRVRHSLLRGDLWAGPLSENRKIVALVNRAPTARNISAPWSTLGFPPGTPVSARDLWKHAELGAVFKDSISLRVDRHDVALLILSPASARNDI